MNKSTLSSSSQETSSLPKCPQVAVFLKIGFFKSNLLIIQFWDKSKLFLTVSIIFCFSTFSVPKHSTFIETGWITQIA